MRALCGAIIAAGALIGLGLASIGIGLRYQSYPYLDEQSKPQWVLFRNIDTSLMYAVVVLFATLVIGLGVAFVGLSYHHHRRTQELLRDNGRRTADRLSV